MQLLYDKASGRILWKSPLGVKTLLMIFFTCAFFLRNYDLGDNLHPIMLKDKVFSIVDVETTGGSIQYDGVIEIGIIQVKNGEIFNEYRSFFKPRRKLSPWISELTGITEQHLHKAPKFKDEAQKIFEMLDGTIFVAHNARFDYSFVKQELKRSDLIFNTSILCTVRLSRKLFPEYKKHSLDALIERFGLSCEHRHRAYDDALMVKKFIDLLPKFHSEEKIVDEVKRLLKQYVVPSKVPEHLIKDLPQCPGIYKFFGPEGALLYVGKSINIRERVFSHFAETRENSKELKMFQELEHIDWQETYGELGALLLEAATIKAEHPLHNRRMTRMKKMTLMTRTTEKSGYFGINLHYAEVIDPSESEHVLGIFRSVKQAEEFLDKVSKKNNLCPKVLGLEKTQGSCFLHRLGKCEGACVGSESTALFNRRFESSFEEVRIKSWPFSGPILVKEAGEREDEGALFLVDKWCLLGEGTYSSDGYHVESRPFHFDFDQYKILSNYLLQKVRKETLVRLTYEEMEQLLHQE